jgi:ubiquinone/menaquinone biosynthesis C-methylase UbiE
VSLFRWTAPLFKLAGRRWSEDAFATIAERLRPYVPTGGVFADLGGGTGDLGAGVARALGARVTVIDPTVQMLRRVDKHALVTTCLAGAEDLPFPDGHFDALLCCDAFHHMRDQESAAREIARVVRPSGAVLILDFAPSGPNDCLARFERMLGEPAAFRSMPEIESLFAGQGITGSCEPQRHGYLFLGLVRPSL